MSNENVQIYPAKTRIVPIIKLIKNLVHHSSEDYKDLLEGAEGGVIEKKNHKKFGEVVTSYKISNAEGYDGTDPLNEFDRAVHSVCISEQDVGNEYTTPAIIFRALTGKVGESDTKIYTNQREAILTSMMKLMSTLIWIDDADTNKKLGYKPTEASGKLSNLLYAEFDRKTINGQDASVIHFIRKSPIMEIAKSRNQIIRYDAALLDVPHLQNTPRNITNKNYLACRVFEIKQHHMTPTITFDDLFRKLRITDTSRKVQMDAREVAIIFFEHLKSKGVIKTFEILKKCNKFHAFKFSY